LAAFFLVRWLEHDDSYYDGQHAYAQWRPQRRSPVDTSGAVSLRLSRGGSNDAAEEDAYDDDDFTSEGSCEEDFASARPEWA
jgi:hypothetical protein